MVEEDELLSLDIQRLFRGEFLYSTLRSLIKWDATTCAHQESLAHSLSKLREEHNRNSTLLILLESICQVPRNNMVGEAEICCSN